MNSAAMTAALDASPHGVVLVPSEPGAPGYVNAMARDLLGLEVPNPAGEKLQRAVAEFAQRCDHRDALGRRLRPDEGLPRQYAAAERHTDARRGRNASCLAGCQGLMIPMRGLRPPLRIPCCNSQQKGQNL